MDNFGRPCPGFPNKRHTVLINLVQLRTFVGVAEEQHLTRAAERLHISQSAASSHVRAIEEKLDTQLFVRTNHSLQLTHVGELLLERARSLLSEASVFTSFARELRGKMEGTLIIGSSSDPSSRLPEIVVCLLQTHPLIRVDVCVRPSASIRQELKSGELDVGVFLGPSADPTLSHQQLDQVNFRIVGPVAWKARIEAADWAALADMPWITPMNSSRAYSSMLSQLFETRGLTPRSVARFDNISMAAAMMQAGLGLTLLRENRALEGERNGMLVISPLAATTLPLLTAHLISRKNDPVIMSFIQAARHVWPGTHPLT